MSLSTVGAGSGGASAPEGPSQEGIVDKIVLKYLQSRGYTDVAKRLQEECQKVG